MSIRDEYYFGTIYSRDVPVGALKSGDVGLCLGGREFLTRRSGNWLTFIIYRSTKLVYRENDLSIKEVAKLWDVSPKEALEKFYSYLDKSETPNDSKGNGGPIYSVYGDDLNSWRWEERRRLDKAGSPLPWRHRGDNIGEPEADRNPGVYKMDRQESSDTTAWVSDPYKKEG